MMTTRKILTCLALLLVSGSIVASDYQYGTQSPLRFGVGARDLALGGSAIADCDAATAPFWNAAMLASAEYLSFNGFHTQLFESDVVYQYAGIAVPTLDFGTFGIGIQRLGISNIEQRDNENVLTGHFSDDRYGFHVAYGTHWGAYQLGVALEVEHHSLGSYSATSSPGINVSIMRSFGQTLGICRDIQVAVAADNVFGSSVELYQESSEQPIALEAGVDVGLFPNLPVQHELDLFAKLTKVAHIDMIGAAGLEYSYANSLDIRGGLRGSNWSVGAGLTYKGFSFDYALVNRELGLLHMFSLTSTFGSSLTSRRLERTERRETAFQSRMHEQLMQRNRETVDELVRSGKTSQESGHLSLAVSDFDRALFVARGSGIDTTAIVSLLAGAMQRLDNEQRMSTHDMYMDSARYYLSAQNALTAQYFANLAASAYPESADARELLDHISQSLEEHATAEAVIQEQVQLIDSLLTYGQFEAAVVRAKSLKQIAPDHDAVLNILKKAQFGSLREQGERALADSEYDRALSLVAEAENLFPGHLWCTSVRNRVAKIKRAQQAEVSSAPAKTTVALSETVRKQVEDLYHDGQGAFDRGEFEDAISAWERVEALAPDYLSARAYLVQAYKYLGVEFYGNNELQQALTVWRRAIELNPGNQEIESYIKRTESEIAKIRELSYEP